MSGLRIGDIAPDFTADTTLGEITFHKYIEGKWALLMSHPADFTPVCTTEIGTVALMKAEWEKRNVLPLIVSVDDVTSHKAWVLEVNKHKNTTVEFPIIGDETKKVSVLYGMLDKDAEIAGLPMTVRSVFVVGPDKKLKLILTYPASTGRNFDEIIRVIDSLQITANRSMATPANWVKGDRLFLSPGVTDEAAAKFADMKIESASCKIRSVPDPDTVEEKKSETMAITAELKIQADKIEEFEAIFSALAATVHATEPGCLLYQLTKSKEDPTKFVVLEMYRDAAAVKFHKESAHYADAMSKFPTVLAGAPKIEILQTVGAHGSKF